MKHTFLLRLCALFLCGLCFGKVQAQDTLLFVNGTFRLTYGTHIVRDSLLYRMARPDTARQYRAACADVAVAAYTDGRRQSFAKAYDNLTQNPAARFAQGRAAASADRLRPYTRVPDPPPVPAQIEALPYRTRGYYRYTGLPAYMADPAFASGYLAEWQAIFHRRNIGTGVAIGAGALVLSVAVSIALLAILVNAIF